MWWGHNLTMILMRSLSIKPKLLATSCIFYKFSLLLNVSFLSFFVWLINELKFEF